MDLLRDAAMRCGCDVSVISYDELSPTSGSWQERIGGDVVVRIDSPGDSAEATRNAGDAIHHLSMLHGRYPGVIDHASTRTASDEARRALFKIADDFARLIVIEF